MADHEDRDAEDIDAIIARSIDNLTLAGISRASIGAVLMARAIFLFRQEGWTDDQIVCEFGAGIQIPIGRNSGEPRTRERRRKSPRL
jgi:hypothetical protein